MKTSISFLSLILVILSVLILRCEAAPFEDFLELKSVSAEDFNVSEVQTAAVEPSKLEIASIYELITKIVWDELNPRKNESFVYSNKGFEDRFCRVVLRAVENGADIRIFSKFSMDEIVKELFRKAIENGADIKIITYMVFYWNVRPESRLEQALLIKLACDYKHYQALEFLIFHDFNVNLVLPSGRSLLHEIVISGDNLLLQHFVRSIDLDINCADGFGNTPLHYASNLELYNALLGHGKADPFKKNNDGIDAFSIHNFDLESRSVIFYHYMKNCEMKNESFNYDEGFFIDRKFLIDRKRVLEDSFYFATKDTRFYDINFYYDIKFKWESGVGPYGLNREWLSLLIERFFVPRSESEAESELDFESLAALLPAISSFSFSTDSSDSSSSSYSTDSSDSSSSSYSTDSSATTVNIPAQDIELFDGAPFECIDSENKLYRVSLGFTGPVEIYKYIGSIMAKALTEFVSLRVKLAPSIVKMLFGKVLTFEDLKDDDPVMYNSLALLLEPGFDFDTLSNDENVTVNSENVQLFLNEKANEVMYLRYKQQIDLLIEGFHSILNIQTVEKFFSPSEFENVLSGALEVSRNDLYKNIDFLGKFWEENKEMFFAGMDLLTNDELFKFVRFVTGINGLPYGGVSSLGELITICDQSRRLPIYASTCYYILYLPTTIKSPEELVEVLRFAFASSPEFFD